MITYASASFGFSFTARSAEASASRRLVAVEQRMREQAVRLRRVRVGVARRDARALGVTHPLLLERHAAHVQQRPRLAHPVAHHARVGGPLVPLVARGAERCDRLRPAAPVASTAAATVLEPDEVAARLADRHDHGLYRPRGRRRRRLLLRLAILDQRSLAAGRRLDRDDGGHDATTPATTPITFLPATTRPARPRRRLGERGVAAVVDLDGLARRPASPSRG